MKRSITPLAIAAALACTLSLGASAGAAADFELSGTWTSAPPSAGTTLTLSQTGDSISWTGGPNNRAWIQSFEGTLSGDIFRGEFKQDEPASVPPRYHGNLEAEVRNDCEFKTLHVEQEGMPDAGGVTFLRAGCTPPAKRGSWQVRAKQRQSGTIVSIIGAGSFSADEGGNIATAGSAKGHLIVAFHVPGHRRADDLWHLRISGPGNYSPISTPPLTGAIKLVAEVMSTANRSLAYRCKSDPFGTLTLRPNGPLGPTVGLIICGRNIALNATLARAVEHR